MPGAELPPELHVTRQRQEAAGRDDPVALDEHGAVVQRRVGEEDASEQLGRHECVESDPELGVVPEAGRPLEDDQRADTPCRERLGRLEDRVEHVRPLRTGRPEDPLEQRPPPDLGERASELRLEEHDQRDHPE